MSANAVDNLMHSRAVLDTQQPHAASGPKSPKIVPRRPLSTKASRPRALEVAAGCSVKHGQRERKRANSASDERNGGECRIYEICHDVLPNHFSTSQGTTKARIWVGRPRATYLG
jgi:hypothetical protein